MNIFKKITFFLAIFLISGFIFYNYNLDIAKAADGDVSGWAWSENIGWISFNTTNFPGGVDYKVHICTSETDSLCGAVATPKTGKFIGYAWSENIGWISFNSGDLSGCPAGTCEAKYDSTTNQISGWARAYRAINDEGQTLGGWTGWIRLDRVSINASVIPAEFKGWAWGGGGDSLGSAVIGWISFNCKNCENNPNCSCSTNLPACDNAPVAGACGVCGTGCHSNYKVIVDLGAAVCVPPKVDNLKVKTPNYCDIGVGPNVILSWDFIDPGDTQSAYQIQIDDDNNLNDDPSDLTPPGGCSRSSDEKIDNSGPRCSPEWLTWNETYYWRVKVWDSESPPCVSEWSEPNCVLQRVEKNNTYDTTCFQMPPHAYPSAGFDPGKLDSIEIAINQTIQFCSVYQDSGPPDYNPICADKSICYDASGQIPSPSCDGASFNWIIPGTQDLDYKFIIPSNNSSKNPKIKFLTDVTGKNITLEITHDGLGPCKKTKSINAVLPLPEWKEIAPF